MPKYHGIDPQQETLQALAKFENEVMIQKNNRFLVAIVYLDVEATRWAVAIAYNPSRKPGLHGHEHLLEVKYSYEPRSAHRILMFRSDPPELTTLPCRRLADSDEFVRYALAYEADLINKVV